MRSRCHITTLKLSLKNDFPTRKPGPSDEQEVGEDRMTPPFEFRSKGSRWDRAGSELLSLGLRKEMTRLWAGLCLSQVRRCVWVVHGVPAIRSLISTTCRAVLPSGRLVRPARWTEGRCSASRARTSRETSNICCR